MNTPAPNLKPLFYTNPVPLDVQKHQAWALKNTINLGFAANAHAVPVNVVEFPLLARHYPVVFTPDASATPVVILGLKENNNLFVTTAGDWAVPNAFIPSYIRRYPFLFAEVSGTDQLTLCIDDVPSVIDPKSGMKLFDGTAPSALTNNALEFCKSFHGATLQTKTFCAALQASGILVEREAEIPLPNGEKLRFGGFRIIDEQKFAALDDKTYLEWRKQGWIAAVYAVLFAGSQWGELARLYVDRQKLGK
jgi:hypothetical protein